MAQPKVIIDYTDVLEGELDNQGQAIFNSLVNNPYFTWANNEIGQLQNLVTPAWRSLPTTSKRLQI